MTAPSQAHLTLFDRQGQAVTALAFVSETEARQALDLTYGRAKFGPPVYYSFQAEFPAWTVHGIDGRLLAILTVYNKTQWAFTRPQDLKGFLK